MRKTIVELPLRKYPKFPRALANSRNAVLVVSSSQERTSVTVRVQSWTKLGKEHAYSISFDDDK